MTHQNLFLLGENYWCTNFIKSEVVEGDSESELLHLFTASVIWIEEFFERKAFVEVQFVDVDQLHPELTISLSWSLNVKYARHLLETGMIEIFDRHAQLYWPVVAAIHLMNAPIEYFLAIRWQITLEKATICVAGSLVFLIDVAFFSCRHLVRWNKVYIFF